MPLSSQHFQSTEPEMVLGGLADPDFKLQAPPDVHEMLMGMKERLEDISAGKKVDFKMQAFMELAASLRDHKRKQDTAWEVIDEAKILDGASDVEDSDDDNTAGVAAKQAGDVDTDMQDADALGTSVTNDDSDAVFVAKAIQRMQSQIHYMTSLQSAWHKESGDCYETRVKDSKIDVCDTREDIGRAKEQEEQEATSSTTAHETTRYDTYDELGTVVQSLRVRIQYLTDRHEAWCKVEHSDITFDQFCKRIDEEEVRKCERAFRKLRQTVISQQTSVTGGRRARQEDSDEGYGTHKKVRGDDSSGDTEMEM